MSNVSTSGILYFSELRNVFGGSNVLFASDYFKNSSRQFTKDVEGIPNIGSLLNMGVFRGRGRPTGGNGLYAFTSHTFTTAGQTGRTGPTLPQVRSWYASAGTWVNVYINMTTTGIQEWTVPATGTYRIEATGAQGGSVTTLLSSVDASYASTASYSYGSHHVGAFGARIRGDFTLNSGDKIGILVGQLGLSKGMSDWGGGGGGASYVVRITSSNTGFYNSLLSSYVEPLIVAAGGGGAGDNGVGNVLPTVGSGDTTSNTSGGGSAAAGGGGGFVGDGAMDFSGSGKSLSFLNGGIGSAGSTPYVGSFGGGGAPYDGGGGGGGYQGGSADNSRGGQGGLSFNAGSNTLNTSGANSGHGSVSIVPLFTITSSSSTPSLPYPFFSSLKYSNGYVATSNNFGLQTTYSQDEYNRFYTTDSGGTVWYIFANFTTSNVTRWGGVRAVSLTQGLNIVSEVNSNRSTTTPGSMIAPGTLYHDATNLTNGSGPGFANWYNDSKTSQAYPSIYSNIMNNYPGNIVYDNVSSPDDLGGGVYFEPPLGAREVMIDFGNAHSNGPCAVTVLHKNTGAIVHQVWFGQFGSVDITASAINDPNTRTFIYHHSANLVYFITDNKWTVAGSHYILYR